MSYEYRVVWRREHDKRKRTKIYQTLTGAQNHRDFLSEPPDDLAMESWLFDHLTELGEVDQAHIERRTVGEWELM